jgi:hypothetical protein
VEGKVDTAEKRLKTEEVGSEGKNDEMIGIEYL